MDIFLPNIFLYFIVALTMLLSLYGLGRLLVQICPEWKGENELSNVFTSYIIGTIMLIGTFALIWTRGNSIYLLLPITTFLYLWWRKSDKQYDSQLDYKKECIYVGISVAVFIVFFALFYYLLFVRSNGEVFFDLIYYADSSRELIAYHHESILRANISISQPYHWHEHWLTAIVTYIFGLNYLYVLCLITYPFFLMLCIYGFSALSSHFKSIPISLCFCLGLLGIVFWNISSLLTPWHGEPIVNLPKSYIMTSSVLWGVMLLLQKRINQAFAALLFICAIYSPLIPGILTLIVLLSWSFYANSLESFIKIVFNKYTIGAIVVAVCILAFYALQPKVVESKLILRQGVHWMTNALMFTIKRAARPVAIMLPVFILSYLIFFRRNRQYWWQYVQASGCVLLSCFVAIIVAALVRQIQLDGGQIATNFYECICGVYVFSSLIGIFAFLLNKFNKTYFYVLIPSLVLFYTLYVTLRIDDNLNIVKGVYSIKEQTQYRIIKNHMSSHPVQSMGYVRNYNVPENKNTHKSRHDLIYPMDKLVHVIPDGYYRPYCLSVFDLPEDLAPLWNDSQESALYQFALKHDTSKDTMKLIKAFVQAKGINYIVVEKDAEIPRCLSDESKLVAEFDGDRLYEILKIE